MLTFKEKHKTVKIILRYYTNDVNSWISDNEHPDFYYCYLFEQMCFKVHIGEIK